MVFSRPRLAITMGDPAGVGPELCLLLLQHADLLKLCQPIIFGDTEILRAAANVTGIPWDESVPTVSAEGLVNPKDTPSYTDHRAVIAHTPAISLHAFEPGGCNAATGYAGFTYVSRAIDAALAGSVVGVATTPLNKEAMHAAGIHFPGHTEIFASRCGVTRSCMLQYSEEISCSFVTVHVGYAEVPQLLTQSRILETIELSAEGLQRIRGRKPKIVVCGLNPHAGEHGLFGDREEERMIEPAIAQAREKGLDVEGPLPPDTAFLPAKRRSTDVFVCMYHDQGHIPVKALAFDSAVNTTLGLPIIRTSVDHGTAADIAWKGHVNPGSFYAAIKLALKLAGC